MAPTSAAEKMHLVAKWGMASSASAATTCRLGKTGGYVVGKVLAPSFSADLPLFPFPSPKTRR